MTLPTANRVAHEHHPDLRVTLDYDARFLRRKVLTCESGERFLVDLPQTTSVNAGDAFVLDDGRRVGIIPAEEPLYEVTGEDMVRLAWHIGNRHTPAQLAGSSIFIQRDHVMADMLTRLGANLREVVAPFTPEGGAYGHGRTHGHDHSHEHVGHDHGTHAHGGHSHEH